MNEKAQLSKKHRDMQCGAQVKGKRKKDNTLMQSKKCSDQSDWINQPKCLYHLGHFCANPDFKPTVCFAKTLGTKEDDVGEWKSSFEKIRNHKNCLDFWDAE